MTGRQPTGIERAIVAAGGTVALATLLGVTSPAISKFHAQGWVPISRARAIHAMYPDIPLRDLVRPDIADILLV
jgi:DNA-binding transcriptional regulator YdaS (Cro superfamily)